MLGISASTASRALVKLEAEGKIRRLGRGLFQWKTDLPVAGENGKGAET